MRVLSRFLPLAVFKTAAVDCVVVACAGMEGSAFKFSAFSAVFRDVLPVSACGFFKLVFFTGFRGRGVVFLSRTFPLFAAGSSKSINIQSVSSLELASIE